MQGLGLTARAEVAIDPAARLVHAGPGCLLGEVDRATQEHGLATVLGFVSETGLAGLTLGGGFGYLARRFGWAVDNLEEVEIVTADAKIRTANRDENADLFWAVRGGGGNLGVVTRFSFRLHEVGPSITGGLIAWSAEEADQVLAIYRELTESAPRELTTAAIALTAPPAPFVPEEWHGKPVTWMFICHSGLNAETDLAALRGLGEPIVDLVTERRYAEQQSLLDDMEPKELCQCWKAEYLPSLSSEYLEVFRDAALRATSPLSYSVIFHIGGALNGRAQEDGAVGNRDARSSAASPASGRRKIHAVPSTEPGCGRPGRRFGPSRLAGTTSTPARRGRCRPDCQRLRGNYQRLRRVKTLYDPDNLFRVNRNVLPTA